MPTRRQLFFVGATFLGLGPVVVWLGNPTRANESTMDQKFPLTKTEQEWRQLLTPEQYHILREHGTERAFTSPLNGEKRHGTFTCAGCGQPLFSSTTKFESGTGWPSFYEPLPNSVGTSVDRSWFMVRTEVHCARCGGHLGHVFEDGPRPTGLRYCMNGAAMAFKADTGT